MTTDSSATLINSTPTKTQTWVGGLWLFSVFSWACLTTLFLMQLVLLNAPLKEKAPAASHWLINGTGSWIWLAATGVLLLGMLVRNARFRRALLSLTGIVPTLLLGLLGALAGAMIFSLFVQDALAQQTTSSMEEYRYIQESMKLFDPAEKTKHEQWFTENGVLRPETKQAWCQNAVARSESFAFMSTMYGKENADVSALLAQSMYTKLYQNDCFDDVQWLSHMHEVSDRAQKASRQHSVIAKLSWWPSFLAMKEARPRIMKRLVVSPSRVCLALIPQHVEGVEALSAYADMCQKRFSTDKKAVLQDIVDVSAAFDQFSVASP